MVLALLIAAFFGPLILFVWAWRGRRIDDHPCCRPCGFDLIGSGEAPSQCPECGQRLTTRQIRIGHRERRRGVLTFAGIVLVAMTLLVAASAWRAANQTSLMAVLPGPVLRILCPYDPLAREELVRRMTADQLGSGTIAAVIATALEVQGDSTQPWDPNWGRFVEQAQAHGHLSTADGERYLKQAVTFTIYSYPQVQIGRTPVLESRLDRPRAGNLDVEAKVRWEDLAVAGQTIDEIASLRSKSNSHRRTSGWISRRHLVTLSPLGESLGTFRVTGRVRIDLTQKAVVNPLSVRNWVTTPDPVNVEIVEHLTGAYADESADHQQLAARSFVGIGTLPSGSSTRVPMLMITQLNRPDGVSFSEWQIDVGHGPEPLHGQNFRSGRRPQKPDGQELAIHTDVWYLDQITQRPGGLPSHFSLILKINTHQTGNAPDFNPWSWGDIRFDHVPRDAPRIDLSFFDRIKSPTDLPPGLVPARALPLSPP